MPNVTVKCDRCGKDIEGAEYPPSEENKLGATAGFYRVTDADGPWARYANVGERILCDDCMWKDERYLADYPHMRR